MERFTVLADIHLGRNIPACSIDAVSQWWDEVLTSAHERGSKAILIAGDLFDKKAKHDPYTVDAAADMFSRAQIPIVVIWGNHDHKSGRVQDFEEAIVAGTEPTVFRLDGVETVIVAASAESAFDMRQLDFPTVDGPALGLLHSSVHGRWSKHELLPTTVASLKDAGYLGWGLGHVHRRVALDEAETIWFAGAPWWEGVRRGYLEYQVSDGALKVEEILL